MISHHPEEALLLDYATGAQSEAVALVIATHAAMCLSCMREINQLETIGGSLLASETPADCNDGALAQILMHLDDEKLESAATAPTAKTESSAILPSPLRSYVHAPLHQLPWKRVGGLYEEHRLPLADTKVRASLFRLAAGTHTPKHSHRGQELVLVLSGGYRDGDAQFARGDFSAMDVADTHQPIVDDDGPCLCLVVQEAPMSRTEVLSLLLRRFLRI